MHFSTIIRDRRIDRAPGDRPGPGHIRSRVFRRFTPLYVRHDRINLLITSELISRIDYHATLINRA